jgi:hypothetical protein
VRPRATDPEKFHTPPLPYYLDEEALDKEVYSCLGVKRVSEILGDILSIVFNFTSGRLYMPQVLQFLENQ